MFIWDEKKVDYYRRAADRAEFFRTIAEHIKPYLNKDMTICDAGCGLGYLSLELAPYVKKVVAVDCQEIALAVLREKAERRHIDNIEIVCSDILKDGRQDQPYDAMVFLSFGSIEEIISCSRRLCRGPVFCLKDSQDVRRFSANGENRGDNIERCEHFLNMHHIAFQKEIFSAEFSQPVRNIYDAKTFYSLYSNEKSASSLTNELLSLAMEQTDDPMYPFLIPGHRQMGMLSWQAQETGDTVRNSYGAVVFENGRVLMVKTRKGWSFPKGHPEGNEMPAQTAEREVFEETGIRVEVDSRLGFTVPSILPEDKRSITFFSARSLDGYKMPEASEVPDAKWIRAELAADYIKFDSDRKVYLSFYDLYKKGELPAHS